MTGFRARREETPVARGASDEPPGHGAVTRKMEKPTLRARILDIEKRSEGRHTIGEVAFRLFVEYGYHSTSVRSIAEAAGMSVGSIFNYFDTKEDILQFVLTTTQQATADTLADTERELEVLKDRLAPAEVFRETYRRYIFAIHETRQYTALAYQETKSLASEQQRLLYGRAQRAVDLLKVAAQPGIQAGVFREDGIDLKIHWLIMLGHAWVLRNWFFRRYRIEDYAEALSKLGLAVLSSELGVLPPAEDEELSVTGDP